MNIKEKREQANISQSELAKQLDVTQGAVSQWEVGISMPRTELLPKLAEVLKCTVDELLK